MVRRCPAYSRNLVRGRTKIGNYGDYVAQTDDAVGRLLRVLEETGTTDNTLVIATSDNGPFWYSANVKETGHAAAGPWRGMKGDAREGGHRIPLIARWPGHVAAGATSDAPVSHTDLLITAGAARVARGNRLDNFKTEIVRHQGKTGAAYERSLHEVWEVTNRL